MARLPAEHGNFIPIGLGGEGPAQPGLHGGTVVLFSLYREFPNPLGGGGGATPPVTSASCIASTEPPLPSQDCSATSPSASRPSGPHSHNTRWCSDSGVSSSLVEASDRFNINSQLEHLQAKYVGTGHADLTRFEWAVNIQRDSYASYIGHYPMLAYFAIAENESIGRERYNFMQKMLLPCGLPPERDED
ncbi:hypothetical protein EJB05_05398, partial [Eragrostis curvula]